MALAVSFEFFPPRTEEMEAQLWRSIARLAPLKPALIRPEVLDDSGHDRRRIVVVNETAAGGARAPRLAIDHTIGQGSGAAGAEIEAGRHRPFFSSASAFASSEVLLRIFAETCELFQTYLLALPLATQSRSAGV